MSEDIDWKAKCDEAEADRQDFEEHYKNAVIRIQVEAEARGLGMTDPDLAVKLVDLSGCSFDENSEIVIGAREAIEELAARKPYLFSPKERGVAPPPKREKEELEAIQKELGIFRKS